MIKKYICVLCLFIQAYSSDTLNGLLEEFENAADNSLQTINEKLGHSIIYSQKELRLMQHHRLSDILKELPLLNLNRNRYGLTTPSLAGTKTTVSGFFRLFINDHEVSSSHTQSFAFSWGEMPLDFVDHVEIYYGDSSFSLGNETGIYFIRVYTKKGLKENATQVQSIFSSKNSSSQSITHSDSFENGWTYLLFLNESRLNNVNNYNNEKLANYTKSKYFYLDVNNDTTNINIGYVSNQKDNYMGLALDAVPDNGETENSDYFIDVSKYLTREKSFKLGASYSTNIREYNEKNTEGLGLIPVIDFTNYHNTLPLSYSEKVQFIKTTGYISKKFENENNEFLTSFYIKNKKQKLLNRKIATATNYSKNKKFNDFNKEKAYSLLFEESYKINKRAMLIANAKFDKYDRDNSLKNSSEEMYRIGAILTPFENFGLKSFYTKTYLPPSFYNGEYKADIGVYKNTQIQTQKYNFFTTEAVLSTEKSKFGITYHDVKIDDFIYLSSVGFVNINHQIKTNGLIFDYEYHFSNRNSIDFNYYTTRSSEIINNSNKGGYIKYMGVYSQFEYFVSVIYKNGYIYDSDKSNKVSSGDSYNLNMGVTYNYSKDISISLKGENLLDDSTESIYTDITTNTNFTLKDFDRVIYLSLKWVF